MDSEGGFVCAFSALMLMMSLGIAVHVDGDFLTWNANSQETWKENGTQADHKEKTTKDLRTRHLQTQAIQSQGCVKILLNDFWSTSMTPKTVEAPKILQRFLQNIQNNILYLKLWILFISY